MGQFTETGVEEDIPEAGFAAGALGLDGAALAGAAGLAGITALAFSSMAITWSLEDGYGETNTYQTPGHPFFFVIPIKSPLDQLQPEGDLKANMLEKEPCSLRSAHTHRTI